jgi:hypothetical protein
LLISMGLWGAGGGGFALAFDARSYLWSVVVVPLLHWGVRRSPGFGLRLATPVIRRWVVRQT